MSADRHLFPVTAASPDVCELVRGMSGAQRRRMVRRAAKGSTELRLALISAWAQLDDDLKRELAESMLDELDDAALNDLFRTAVDHGATSELVSVLTGLR